MTRGSALGFVLLASVLASAGRFQLSSFVDVNNMKLASLQRAVGMTAVAPADPVDCSKKVLDCNATLARFNDVGNQATELHDRAVETNEATDQALETIAQGLLQIQGEYQILLNIAINISHEPALEDLGQCCPPAFLEGIADAQIKLRGITRLMADSLQGVLLDLRDRNSGATKR